MYMMERDRDTDTHRRVDSGRDRHSQPWGHIKHLGLSRKPLLTSKQGTNIYLQRSLWEFLPDRKETYMQ